jgi:hypothetical protein
MLTKIKIRSIFDCRIYAMLFIQNVFLLNIISLSNLKILQIISYYTSNKRLIIIVFSNLFIISFLSSVMI